MRGVLVRIGIAERRASSRVYRMNGMDRMGFGV